jgi:hypothetical protein
VPRNVFEKDPFGLNLTDDPGNVGPEVAGVFFALSLSRCGKRLAWVSGKYGVADAAPWSAVKGSHVVPDGGWGEVSGALCGDEDRSRIFFPLDEAGGGKARLGKVKTHVKSAAA